MAVFTVEKDGRYKQGVGANAKYVAAHEVPEVAKTALKGTAPGSMVDELGDRFDPETDTDESTDESLPTKTDESTKAAKATPKKTTRKAATAPADDDAEDDTEEDETDDEEEVVDPNNVPVAQDEEGMGWPRANGKTLSIFSKKPHETVKAVGGHLVPMTLDEYATKTDAEILKKLRSMKRI